MSGEGPIIEGGQAAAASGGGEELSITDVFAGVVRRHRDRVAVRTTAERWSYGELAERSGVVAARLAERGVGASEPVAVLLEHAPPLVAAIMGVLRAGGMYVCLDPADPPVRHQAVLAEARPRWLVTDAEHEPLAVTLMGGRAGVINLDALERTGGAIGNGDRVSGDGGAWLMYTSGSTGRPKGVWQSHRNVIHHTRVYTELAGIGEEDCLSMLASAGVAASATAFFGALLNGASLAMFSVRREGVERLGWWLDEQGVTICHLAPSVFRRLAQVPGGPGVPGGRGRWSRMRVLRLGGEAVLGSDVELYRGACPDGCRLMHALSSTETGLISHLMIDKASAVGEGVVPVGRAVAGVEVLILDEAGRLCEEIGREGRIAVRSRHLAMGYWRQPELTAATFECVPGRAGVRQFVSGDVGRVLEDGSLEHLGRADRQVKIRGWRVDLGAVEAAILATGRVAEAAVVARKDDHGEARLTAYVVPAPGQKPGRTAWREVLGEGVASPMMPHTFIEMPCLPQSASGKIDRAALAAMPATGVEHRPRGAPPRDHIERKVAEIWETVLGVRGLGLDDDFFELGGDSLLGVDVLLRVEQMFDLSLSPSSLIEHPSLRSFAAVVAKRSMPGSSSPLVSVRAVGSRPPLFLVHPATGSPECFGVLARLLDPEQPVYAFRSPGLLGECWPLASVPAMARRYVRELLAVAPQGPYLLGGASAGGLIAMEMARQLTQSGRDVAMVILIDTQYPPLRPRTGWHRVMDCLRDTVRLIRWGFWRAIGVTGRPGSLPGYRRFVSHLLHGAINAYRPGLYEGDLTLLVSSDQDPVRRERVMMMLDCCRQMRVVTIPGNHDDMFRQPIVRHVARELQAWLDGVSQASGGMSTANDAS